MEGFCCMPAEEVGLTLCITVKDGISIGIKMNFHNCVVISSNLKYVHSGGYN